MTPEIQQTLDYLNKHFNQDSPEYSIFDGSKPQVIRISPSVAASLWACGAIVCIGKGVVFIEEDDGHWYTHDYVDLERIRKPEDLDFWRSYPASGTQGSFSLAWGESFVRAFQDLIEYVKVNGKPYYYVLGYNEDGSEILSEAICGYELCG